MPRLSKRTPAIVNEILERLSAGEPLATMCRDEHLPTDQCFRDWMAADESLAVAYARAREVGEDAITAHCLEIADDARNDFMAKINGDGEDAGVAYNAEHVQRSKLRIETRLKLLAIWNPKKYGAKLDMTSDGEKLQLAAIIAERREKLNESSGD